ncbi:hypothetical protein KC19_11G131000 [Ceratodon purpureus]|uniref:Uncharacterized protein n=1 Tax=Ceratodon purpureus TaxID=3225 RepID=A0A8T0GFX6_CERPU|nr:hypothetical protein KC19_11G131000 [Ceratodon purpureus]
MCLLELLITPVACKVFLIVLRSCHRGSYSPYVKDSGVELMSRIPQEIQFSDGCGMLGFRTLS